MEEREKKLKSFSRSFSHEKIRERLAVCYLDIHKEFNAITVKKTQEG